MSSAAPTTTPRHGASLAVFPDQASLSRAAAEEIVHTARSAVEQTGRFTIALSGGPAPGPVFELLADEHEPFRERFPWDATHFFWGDERHVAPHDPESNFRLAHEKMLSKVPVPEGNIHRVRAELPDAHEAAAQYESEVRQFFQLRPDDFPQFDLMWQGLGANGHTASLFALVLAPDWAEHYNGQQGDMWDAQKDMGLAALGAFVALLGRLCFAAVVGGPDRLRVNRDG